MPSLSKQCRARAIYPIYCDFAAKISNSFHTKQQNRNKVRFLVRFTMKCYGTTWKIAIYCDCWLFPHHCSSSSCTPSHASRSLQFLKSNNKQIVCGLIALFDFGDALACLTGVDDQTIKTMENKLFTPWRETRRKTCLQISSKFLTNARVLEHYRDIRTVPIWHCH